MSWAPRCVAKVETVQVARIIRIVPLSTLSFSRRIGSPSGVCPSTTLYPTITAASVAATCAELKPKITVRWSRESRKVFCVR